MMSVGRSGFKKKEMRIQFDPNRVAQIIKENDVDSLIQYHETHAIRFHGLSIPDSPIKNGPFDTKNLSEAHLAAYYNAFECLKYLIENYKLQYVNTSSGFEPIHYATLGNSLECVHYLCKIAHYKIPEIKPKLLKNSPLYLSTSLPDTTVFQFLLENLSFSFEEIEVSLQNAINLRKQNFINIIINHLESNINYTKKSLNPNLIKSVIKTNSIEILKSLFRLPIKLLFNSTEEANIVRLAIQKNNIEMFNLLLKRRFIDIPSLSEKNSLLHLAAKTGNPEMIQFILENIEKTDVKALDAYGNNAAFYVTNLDDIKSVECFKLLIDAGISINSCCNSVHLFSHVICDNRTIPEVVLFFLNNGVNLDLVGLSDKTLYEIGLITASPLNKEILISWKKNSEN